MKPHVGQKKENKWLDGFSGYCTASLTPLYAMWATTFTINAEGDEIKGSVARVSFLHSLLSTYTKAVALFFYVCFNYSETQDLIHYTTLTHCWFCPRSKLGSIRVFFQ